MSKYYHKKEIFTIENTLFPCFLHITEDGGCAGVDWINVPCIMIQRYNRPRLENVLLLHGYDLVIPENDESFTRRLLMLRKR